MAHTKEQTYEMLKKSRKLEGVDLSYLDFSGDEFRNVNLKNSNCKYTIFRDCYLSHIDFTDADLTGLILDNAIIFC